MQSDTETAFSHDGDRIGSDLFARDTVISIHVLSIISRSRKLLEKSNSLFRTLGFGADNEINKQKEHFNSIVIMTDTN